MATSSNARCPRIRRTAESEVNALLLRLRDLLHADRRVQRQSDRVTRHGARRSMDRRWRVSLGNGRWVQPGRGLRTRSVSAAGRSRRRHLRRRRDLPHRSRADQHRSRAGRPLLGEARRLDAAAQRRAERDGFVACRIYDEACGASLLHGALLMRSRWALVAMGAWLAGTICVSVVATENFYTIDRLLAERPNPH